MAKRISQNGKVVAVEFTRADLAKLWKIDETDLDTWKELIEPTGSEAGQPVYRFTQAQLAHAKKLAMVLRTRMSVRQVQKVINEGMLDAYAALAEDCPYERGVSAHVWRSYAVIAHIQLKEGRSIDEHELAWRAKLYQRNPLTGDVEPSPSLAEKHIRLLVNAQVLDHNGTEWVHNGLPKALSGRQR